MKVAATEIAGSDLGLFATTGGTTSGVDIWSLRERRRIAHFPIEVDVGGGRLALTGQPPLLTSASWRTESVTALSVDTGDVAWRREIAGTLEVAGLGKRRLAIIRESQPVIIVESATGRTDVEIERSEEARGNDENIVVTDTNGDIGYWTIADAKRLWSATIHQFQLLDAAIGPRGALVSNVAGDVYAFSVEGDLMWSWRPPGGFHAANCAWSEQLAQWCGVVVGYDSARSSWLITWTESGDARNVGPLGEVGVAAFVDHGDFVVASNGEVRAVTDGRLMWRFAEGLLSL